MPLIKLETRINAPIERCFDLARDVTVHAAAAGETNEHAVAGVTNGMMQLNDTVTWEATHFGIRQQLTSRITVFEPPHLFIDEMQRGAFHHWHHQHRFVPQEAGTLMLDEVDFASPLGFLGQLVDAVFLKNYMTRFLVKHNEYIKRVAEGGLSSAEARGHS
ncbi:MAG TPA: SRPBCC family protein [Pyrinomonadaceae bacterium]